MIMNTGWDGCLTKLNHRKNLKLMNLKRLMRKNSENLIHAAAWLLVFAMPVIMMYVQMADSEGEHFEWSPVLLVWKVTSIYFLVFLVHNFLIAPLLISQKRRKLYLMFVLLLAVTSLTNLYLLRLNGKERARAETVREAAATANVPGNAMPAYQQPEKWHRRLVIFGESDVVGLAVLVLMLGMNLAVKLFFKEEEDQLKLQQLQQENLEHQLAYLKFRFNPHFFMNTLDNIHAQVDIEPEKSKASILVLSRMMRYILYEGNLSFIPLRKEVAFIRNYITLMRTRYTEKVSIGIDLPGTECAGQIPPLLLITFVENAFKHGISHGQESAIKVSLRSNSEGIIFTCTNTKGETAAAESGGVGLSKVRKRLSLIYQEDYQLDITDDANSYDVVLALPAGAPVQSSLL